LRGEKSKVCPRNYQNLLIPNINNQMKTLLTKMPEVRKVENLRKLNISKKIKKPS
jgi:hypothetical protein